MDKNNNSAVLIILAMVAIYIIVNKDKLFPPSTTQPQLPGGANGLINTVSSKNLRSLPDKI